MATNIIGKETRRNINQVPALLTKMSELLFWKDKTDKFLFTGDIDNNTPSLSERVRNIERSTEKILVTVNRLGWVIITALLTAITLYGWDKLVK